MTDNDSDDFELGRCVFERIDRSRFQEWAEEISDDEDLEDEHKAMALRLIAEYADSDREENVVVEFVVPLCEEAAARQVALAHLRACSYVKLVWKRTSADRELWGLQLGYEVWKPETGEAA